MLRVQEGAGKGSDGSHHFDTGQQAGEEPSLRLQEVLHGSGISPNAEADCAQGICSAPVAQLRTISGFPAWTVG